MGTDTEGNELWEKFGPDDDEPVDAWSGPPTEPVEAVSSPPGPPPVEDEEPAFDEEPDPEPVADDGDRVPPFLIALAGALFVLFFVPWFDTGPPLRASGAGFVQWTGDFLADLPSRQFDVGMVVPFALLLIPIGALAIVLLAIRGRWWPWLAAVTGAIAPLVLLYAGLRENGDVFDVLAAGAYLTVAVSLVLVAASAGWFDRRPGQSAGAAALAVLVIAAFVLPALQDEPDAPMYLAYAANETGSLEDPSNLGRTVAAPAERDAEETTTPTTMALTLDDTTATTVATTVASTAPPTTAAAVTATTCPRQGPTSSVDHISWEQHSAGSDLYDIDARGTVSNTTGASIEVQSVELAVTRGGAVVGTISIPASRVLGNGQVLEWFQNNTTMQIQGGPPDGGRVAAAPYRWAESRLASCAVV